MRNSYVLIKDGKWVHKYAIKQTQLPLPGQFFFQILLCQTDTRPHLNNSFNKRDYCRLPHPSGRDLSSSKEAADCRPEVSPTPSDQSERGRRRLGCTAPPHLDWILSGVSGGEGSKRARISSAQKLEPTATVTCWLRPLRLPTLSAVDWDVVAWPFLEGKNKRYWVDISR